ncbi:helix-turn-helix domain containing protein [Lederbergia lenta]|uniref:helix-turn-helix domain containing protein n=1 Tax=Lederbergia lenta TaxID=1467 RepID=UPI00203C7616|nr:helix-turn-helix domain containing protein [Lederbergia lenta]MCM3111654.1 helix-turn-helix domain containing protein [Lederbergia lenta]
MDVLHNKYSKIYIACENFNFIWTEDEVFDFECMWDEGKTLLEIAEYFNRPEMEILFLAADRAELDKITDRKGGLIGEVSNVREKDESC